MEVCITMVVVTTAIILMLVMVEVEEVIVEEAVYVDLTRLELHIGSLLPRLRDLSSNDSSRICYVRDIVHFRVRYSTDLNLN
jgi:hypothetical protein